MMIAASAAAELLYCGTLLARIIPVELDSKHGFHSSGLERSTAITLNVARQSVLWVAR